MKGVGCLLPFILLFRTSLGSSHNDSFLFGTFPPEFKWGASSSAYKIEGGYAEDGKGLSIWDVYVTKPGNIKDKSTGDVACNSYNNFKEDVKALTNLGANTYRFSISWARVMPSGMSPTNEPGINYYANLIQELKQHNITPVVTLYDNDMPDDLQKSGGWLNAMTENYFVQYARICFQRFGNDVTHWVTFNDPLNEAINGYGNGSTAPGIWGLGTYTYLAGQKMISAHRKVYTLYRNDFFNSQRGQVGISLSSPWYEPMDPTNALDRSAQERAMHFQLGWFVSPLFLNGDYPDIMKDTVSRKSPGTASRLPNVVQFGVSSRTADFLELVYKPAAVVTSKVFNCDPPSYFCDRDIIEKPDTSWMGHASPTGLRKILNWIKNEYGNIMVYVKESGYGDTTGTLEDKHRIYYMKHHIGEVLEAVNEDGCQVNGYFASSLMDSFEWNAGYTMKYGLYHVDHTDPETPRTEKASVRYFRQLINDNGIQKGFPGPAGMESGAVPYEDEFQIYFGQFPDNFVWGVGSSALQVEGAWNVDGKGASIWDVAGHANKIQNGQTTDISSDQYHHYKHDVQLLKRLGVTQYRFSIAWSRIFPDGTNSSYNSDGMAYYRNLISELRNNQIEPLVILYNSDLPQALEDRGGWMDEATIDLFLDYADTCFRELGSHVKQWITINDPRAVAVDGYGSGTHPPYHQDIGVAPYIVGKNLILAHAQVYRHYENMYKNEQNGTVGIALHFLWAEPKNRYSNDDVEAAERFLQMNVGWFADPILGTGDYPSTMYHQVTRKSRAIGMNSSRLPEFTYSEKQIVKGSCDFLGVNMYTSVLISSEMVPDNSSASFYNDQDVKKSHDPTWIGTDIMKVTPFGMRKALNWIKYQYNNPPVYVTGNGLHDKNGSLIDEHRIHYYRTYINGILKAINLDDCQVKGYSGGSLLDGFEGTLGYTYRGGFYNVDFGNSSRPRTARGSAHWFSILTKENAFNPGFTQPVGWGTAPQYTDQFYYDTFPEDFLFSTATSSAQIEGAWNIDGKGYSIWDTFANAGRCKENATPQVACDSYHKYREDVKIINDLGVGAYRFSIAWARVMTDGTRATRNQKGIDYYNNLINELLSRSLKPVVTIFHWDLPQALQDHGGWLNESIVDWFRDYAALCFEEFGDRVPMWLTLNEPWVFTVLGYGSGTFAPGIVDMALNPYIATHNAIKSHAEAYHQYHDVYKGSGRIGITLNIDWSEPQDKYNMGDVDASEAAVETFLGWYANPIYVNGDYPQLMKEILARNSKFQGYNESRLPEFSEYWKQRINGSSDFFGMNHYTTNEVVYQDPKDVGEASYWTDRGAWVGTNPKWPGSGSSWLKVVPWGIRRILNWVKTHYGDLEIFITENGVSDNNQTLDDASRVHFYTQYINEVLKAVRLDGIRVIGYTAWSVMDNFEWQSGYTEYFGIYQVNFTDPNRPRKPKASAALIRNIARDNGFIKGALTDPYAPKALPMENDYLQGDFPADFSWGASSTAYETEGAWNIDGKGESVLDAFYHASGVTRGDMVADSYHRYKEDVQALKQISANRYFLTLSWSRILPRGTNDDINLKGIQYYENFLKELVKNNIHPTVSLYSWDMPVILEKPYLGWLNESNIDVFVNYARVCFENFGHLVRDWVTFNEPQYSAYLAYESGQLPPAGVGRTDDMYLAVHNMIKAHVRVYHMHYSEFHRRQRGHVGIILKREWYISKNHRNPADNDAVLRNQEFEYGWLGDPLFRTGDYPPEMKNRVNMNSTRLPSFTVREQELNKGAVDFVGINHHATYRVGERVTSGSVPSFMDDKGVEVDSSGLVHPKGIRLMLKEMAKRYPSVPIFISGNGVSEKSALANNMDKSSYIKLSTNEVLKAIELDRVNVKGYMYSPLLDVGGENKGLFTLDSSSGNLSRQGTQSSTFYQSLVAGQQQPTPATVTAPAPAHTTSCNCPKQSTDKPSGGSCPTVTCPEVPTNCNEQTSSGYCILPNLTIILLLALIKCCW